MVVTLLVVDYFFKISVSTSSVNPIGSLLYETQAGLSFFQVSFRSELLEQKESFQLISRPPSVYQTGNTRDMKARQVLLS